MPGAFRQPEKIPLTQEEYEAFASQFVMNLTAAANMMAAVTETRIPIEVEQLHNGEKVKAWQLTDDNLEPPLVVTVTIALGKS